MSAIRKMLETCEEGLKQTVNSFQDSVSRQAWRYAFLAARGEGKIDESLRDRGAEEAREIIFVRRDKKNLKAKKIHKFIPIIQEITEIPHARFKPIIKRGKEMVSHLVQAARTARTHVSERWKGQSR